MAGALTGNPKVATRFPPFDSVRQNPSARTEMCQQVSQLVAQRPIDFAGPEFLQGWIQENDGAMEISATDGSAHAVVPFHSQTRRQFFGPEVAQK